VDPTRRTFVLGGLGLAATALAAGAAGVETGVLPGKNGLERLLGLAPADVPANAPGRIVSGSFESRARGGVRTSWTVAYPPGHDNSRLPVLVALHGRGGNHRDAFAGSLRLERFLAQACERGASPFAIASVDGGDHGYWHPRRDEDPAAMVTNEFLPLLGARGLDVSRVGLLGWSMGGYGALYLAGALGQERVPVAVAESPALWAQAGESAAGAFDDAQDFDDHSILAHLPRLAGIAVRVDCGAADDFAPISRVLRARLSPTPAGGIEPGGHDARYWRSQAAAQLTFVAQHLAI
jgi:enterochelin esterase-like enzyme